MIDSPTVQARDDLQVILEMGAPQAPKLMDPIEKRGQVVYFISTALSLVCCGLPCGRNDDCKPRATAVCFCPGSEAYGAPRGGGRHTDSHSSGVWGRLTASGQRVGIRWNRLLPPKKTDLTPFFFLKKETLALFCQIYIFAPAERKCRMSPFPFGESHLPIKLNLPPLFSVEGQTS
jgi:hypothetical protein